MWFYVALIGVLLFLYAKGKKYRNSYLMDIEGSKSLFIFCYPSVGFWLHKFRFFSSNNAKKVAQTYRSIYPGEDYFRRYYLELCRKLSVLFVSVFSLCIIAILVSLVDQQTQTNQYLVKRPSAGSVSDSHKVHLVLKEGEKRLEQEFVWDVEPRKYSEEELKKYEEEAKSYVTNCVRGENATLSEVSTSLNFVRKIPSNPFRVSWIVDGQDVIKEDGTLNNKKINEICYVTIQAALTYKKREVYLEIPVGVMPYQWTWEEEVKEGMASMLSEMDEKNSTKESYTLPSRIGNTSILYVLPKKKHAVKVFFLGVGSCAAGIIYWKEGVKRIKKKRDKESELLYPNIVYKITLLLGAGMTFRGAWNRIIQDYIESKKAGSSQTQYVYEEMIITWNEIESGISESEAFSRFGKRMQLRPYMRFSSMIAQNLKKGTKGFLLQLEAEAKEAQEERKQLAKRLGEEAGTKLVFPMLVMLVIVLAIVMVPALLSFSKGGL
ncbi:hypothetical protein [[Clostridium] polysaccharolyticum]|uniref:Type II secretion system (T2SS), protein F n=1 Tax=[Clostridium] polysaccharolyticum TaxID=29364 RepID=A0A1I0DB65_9FIRM|nr:hypothetical protein [[Clostridium] polysaccharolyticum]SET28813.1 hypothetical protein SAMN04487772_11366 [[Clostridium] polysaccharolyticum]